MLLDRLETANINDIDLIREFALQLPAFVIMDMLDVPRDMLDEFKEWSDDMAVFIGGARTSGDKYKRAASRMRKDVGLFSPTHSRTHRKPQARILDGSDQCPRRRQ